MDDCILCTSDKKQLRQTGIYYLCFECWRQYLFIEPRKRKFTDWQMSQPDI